MGQLMIVYGGNGARRLYLYYENSTSRSILRSKHVTFAKDKVYDSRVQLLFCIVREVKSDLYILS